MAVQVSPNEVHSFLAFLYRIRFDPAVSQVFKASAESANAVMADFELTDEEKGLVNDLHDYYLPPAVKAAKWAKLVTCLVPEFYSWTYDVSPPAWW